MSQAQTPAPPRGVAGRPRGAAATAARTGIVEEARLGYRCGIYDLILPATTRARALAAAEAQFALIVEEPLILLAYRFGEPSPWALARFAWQDAPRQDQTPPPGAAERGLLAVGRRRPDGAGAEHVRNLTLALDFTRALDDAVRDLSRTPPAPHEEDRALQALRRRHPSIGSLVARAVARSAGMP